MSAALDALRRNVSGAVERGEAEPVVNVPPSHDCMDHAYPHDTDGPLGHGWSCGVCGEFLQAG